jgi:hypothetical protein
VDLAPGHGRRLRVEQGRQAAQQAALRLPAQAEQDHVVAREDAVHEPRHHRVLVAEDAREQRLARAHLGEEVAPHLLAHALRRRAARALELAEGPGLDCHGSNPPERL